jgi:hypothetical protein
VPVPGSGLYRVAFSFAAHGNRATSVPVEIETAEGTKKLTLNQRKKEAPFAFVPLGDFVFDSDRPAKVTVSNRGTDGYVVVDAVRLIPLESSAERD